MNQQCLYPLVRALIEMPTECQESQAVGREWKVREDFPEEVISKASSVIQWTWHLVGFSDLLLSMYTFT